MNTFKYFSMKILLVLLFNIYIFFFTIFHITYIKINILFYSIFYIYIKDFTHLFKFQLYCLL